MATIDPTVTPGSAEHATASSEAVDDETMQGNLAEGEARAASNVGELDNFVSPTGGSGTSHIGAVEDRTGGTNSTTSI